MKRYSLFVFEDVVSLDKDPLVTVDDTNWRFGSSVDAANLFTKVDFMLPLERAVVTENFGFLTKFDNEPNFSEDGWPFSCCFVLVKASLDCI